MDTGHVATPTNQTPSDIGPRDRPELRRIGYWRALERSNDPIPKHADVLDMAPLRADGGHIGSQAEAFMRLPWPGDHLDPNMPIALREQICDARVWPVGLAHYVADHGLVLCDDFLRSLGI
jgi:hypothetical protein